MVQEKDGAAIEQPQRDADDFTDEDWWEQRREGIGGSDAAAVVGLHPYKTERELWEEIRGIRGPDDPTGDMRRGTVLEPVAAGEYQRVTGRRVRRQPIRLHPDHPFIRGNIDRQILAGSGDEGWEVDETSILEIYCPNIQAFSRVRAYGIPDYKVVQLQHYLAVYGYSFGSYAVFNADRWHTIPIDIPRDEAFIEELIQREREWWQKHIVGDTPPEERTNGGPDMKIPEVTGEVVVLDDPKLIDTAEQFIEMRALRKESKELEKIAKKELQEKLEEIGLGTYEIHYPEEGRLHRFYFNERSRSYFKKERVAELYPVALEDAIDAVRAVAEAHGWELVQPLEDQLREELEAAVIDITHDRFRKESSWMELRPYPNLDLDDN